MNEFNPQAPDEDATPCDLPVTPVNPGLRYHLLERKYLLGLTGPWLAGLALALLAGLWYTLAPDSASGPSVNDLAGLDSLPASEPVQTRAAPVLLDRNENDNTQFQTDMTRIVTSVKEYSSTNRTAIQRLSDDVKGLTQQVARQQQLIGQYQSQIDALKTRQVMQDAAPATTPVKTLPPHPSPVATMHLSAIQDGAAWIYWAGKTWSVKEGDTLGNVSISHIDAQNRQVFTPAGTIR